MEFQDLHAQLEISQSFGGVVTQKTVKIPTVESIV
jgi:hypothetical protein